MALTTEALLELEKTQGLTLAQLRTEVDRYCNTVQWVLPETKSALAQDDETYRLWYDAGQAVLRFQEALRETR
ncbi:hypothetical protein QEN35_22000 [Gordonia alkanivorans]|uniref:hypothetical protein n=1 Tax=Gordonia alkanivorans TaxID=84096 RepID=UPI0024489A96|nr:hypothetical protein [Gordonia alkanivorans]MDH3027029.1 hypothetical protein [Gordonia alkanivorans]MDH3050764.1 hypothetical protein [Gordonia alkanivorans]